MPRAVPATSLFCKSLCSIKVSSSWALRLLIMLACCGAGLANAKPGEGHTTWYGGLSWLNLKTDQITEQLLRENHDRRFFSFAVGGQAYGQRRAEFEDATTGFKVFVGVSVHEDWDWEGGYVNFGSTEASYTAGQITAPFTESALSAEAELEGMFLHVQYRYQYDAIEGLELVPRVGILAWDGQVRSIYQNDDINIGALKFVNNDRGYDEYYGVGLSYHIYGDVRIRVDYDRYNFGSTKADVVSATLDFPVPKIPYVMWD